MNIIIYADEIAAKYRAAGVEWKLVSKGVQDEALANHPVYLGMITGVKYLEKADRYTVNFGTCSAKATTEAATFLLAEVFSPKRSARPTVYAHMTEGVIDGVCLLYISKEGN